MRGQELQLQSRQAERLGLQTLRCLDLPQASRLGHKATPLYVLQECFRWAVLQPLLACSIFCLGYAAGSRAVCTNFGAIINKRLISTLNRQAQETEVQLLATVLTRLDRLLGRVDTFAADLRARHMAKLSVKRSDLLALPT